MYHVLCTFQHNDWLLYQTLCVYLRPYIFEQFLLRFLHQKVNRSEKALCLIKNAIQTNNIALQLCSYLVSHEAVKYPLSYLMDDLHKLSFFLLFRKTIGCTTQHIRSCFNSTISCDFYHTSFYFRCIPAWCLKLMLCRMLVYVSVCTCVCVCVSTPRLLIASSVMRHNIDSV